MVRGRSQHITMVRSDVLSDGAQEVEALDIALELKTSARETVFVAFPNEATFADCKGGEIAQVLTDNVMLPDYDFIPGARIHIVPL